MPTKATRAAIKSTWNEPKTLSQLGIWNVTCPYTSAPAMWLYRPLDTSWRRWFRHLAATRRRAQKQARNSVTLEATEALPLLRHRPSSSSAAATLARLGISRFLFQPSAQRLVRKHQRFDPPDGKQSTVHIHKQDVDPPRRHCYRTDFPEQAGAIQGYQGSKYSRRTSHWAGNPKRHVPSAQAIVRGQGFVTLQCIWLDLQQVAG